MRCRGTHDRAAHGCVVVASCGRILHDVLLCATGLVVVPFNRNGAGGLAVDAYVKVQFHG